MRGLVLAPLVCWLGVAAPAAALAQTASQPPSTTPLATPAQEKPAPAAPAAEAEAEVPRSLFEPTWRQFQIGGRLSSVSGDPARWQRYQDLRDGVLFTDARYEKEDPNGAWLFHAAADNVGFHDQRYFADYERTGRFVISGLWDEIPQFYSVDTKTPYTTTNSPLVLDDATQRSIQNGQATLSAWIPVAPQFDLTERRDIGRVNFVATPTPQLDVKASFTTQRHVGELPWGASFGFGNDVEVALPYESRTNDLSLGTEWTNGRNMVRVAYDGSWFDNIEDTLVWDSPLRLDDSTSAPGRGRMALWPSNFAQTISAAGYTKLARRTQVTGFVSLGHWSNDEPLQPFTINADAAAAHAAARQHAGRSARLFDEHQFRLSSDDRLAYQRPPAALRLQQRKRAHGDSGIHQLRHVRHGVVDRRARAVRALAHDVRCRCHLDRAHAARCDRRLYAEQQQPRLPHVRRHRRGCAPADGRCGGDPVGHVPGAVRACRAQRFRTERRSAHRDRRAAGAASLRPRQSLAQSLHRPGRRDAE